MIGTTRRYSFLFILLKAFLLKKKVDSLTSISYECGCEFSEWFPVFKILNEFIFEFTSVEIKFSKWNFVQMCMNGMNSTNICFITFSEIAFFPIPKVLKLNTNSIIDQRVITEIKLSLDCKWYRNSSFWKIHKRTDIWKTVLNISLLGVTRYNLYNIQWKINDGIIKFVVTVKSVLQQLVELV